MMNILRTHILRHKHELLPNIYLKMEIQLDPEKSCKIKINALIENSFFLSFFLSVTAFYPITVGVEYYCCTWLHSVTHTHTHTHTHTQTNTRKNASGQRITDNKYNLVYNETYFIKNSRNIYNSIDTVILAPMLEIDSVPAMFTA